MEKKKESKEKIITLTIKDLANNFVVQGQQQVFIQEAMQFFEAINKWALERNISFEQALGVIASLYPFDLEATKDTELKE